MSIIVPRPDDSVCIRPLPPEVLVGYHAPDHLEGIYVSTYCEHGLGAGRDKPSLCRLACKECKAPCACLCHGGQVVPFEGFSVSAEDGLRAAARRVAREKLRFLDGAPIPEGPRGVELISDIATSMWAEYQRNRKV